MQDIKKRRGPNAMIRSDAKRPLLKQGRTIVGSCREIGLLIGVTESAVRKTEDGQSTPNLQNAFMYSILLGKPLDKLFPDVYKAAIESVGSITKTK